MTNAKATDRQGHTQSDIFDENRERTNQSEGKQSRDEKKRMKTKILVTVSYPHPGILYTYKFLNKTGQTTMQTKNRLKTKIMNFQTLTIKRRTETSKIPQNNHIN